jgi:hypothetical protein
MITVTHMKTSESLYRGYKNHLSNNNEIVWIVEVSIDSRRLSCMVDHNTQLTAGMHAYDIQLSDDICIEHLIYHRHSHF